MKKMVKSFMLALTLAATLGLGAGGTAEAAKKVTVKKVTSVDKVTGKKKITLTKGKKANLTTTVTVTPNKKANKKVTYKSSNKKVATVSKKGQITAKKTGSAKITVASKKNSKKKATVTVKVVAGKVTKVTLDKTAVTLKVNATETLKATVATSGKKPNKTLVWTSSDAKVATVSAKGVVTAKGVGKATITAMSTDGTKKKATATVTVEADQVAATTQAATTVAATTEAPAQVITTEAVGTDSTTEESKPDATTEESTENSTESTEESTENSTESTEESTEQQTDVWTKVAVKENATATVSVKVEDNADKEAAAADVEKLVKAATSVGNKKTVTVNDEEVTVENKADAVYVGNVTLAEYINAKTATEATVTVSYDANAAKAVAAIELAKFTAKGDYNYTIKVGSVEFKDLKVKEDGITLTVDGKEYTADVKAGVIYVEGDVTADDFAKKLANYADLEVVNEK